MIENKDFHGWVVDLWVEDPNSEQQYALYLMNKLAGLTIKQENQLIELKHHGAEDCGRYDFLKQVEKLEKITTGRDKIKGIAILLTNDHLYWSAPTRAHTVDSYFRIQGNRILTGELINGWNMLQQERQKTVKTR
ncbi:hypothetical protein [Aeribacillus pallidus]|uniref:hypothetical protein n=1 Tax=Aeribacillus pallidus TaxID=33936 RepID=UPI003D223D87